MNSLAARFGLCVCALLLSHAQLGWSQTINCFNTGVFGCSGTAAGQFTGTDTQACCTAGYLAYAITGQETCFVCPDNVVCHSDSQCQNLLGSTVELAAMSLDNCCLTNGLSYFGSNGICNECPPRPTTVPTTQVSTEVTSSESEGSTIPTSSTEETATTTGVPTIEGPGPQANGLPVGAIVGGVIGALVLVVIIIIVVIIIVVVVVTSRKSSNFI